MSEEGIPEVVPQDPRCRGACKGDRGALESPAVIVKIKGKDRLGCPCCGNLLQLVPGATDVRPPNLSPRIDARSVRFTDVICGYDVVALSDLRST